MTAAFKEWAIVVDALGRGEQIFILRKGGLHEDKGGFRLEHPVFALFPTLYHQQRDEVIESARKRYDEISPACAPEGSVFIHYFARVVEWEELKSFDDVRRLRGQHIWKEELLRERFEWGKEKMICAIAVRVFRLDTALELPWVEEYAGCKSWVDLTHEVSHTSAAPVLKQSEFDAKLDSFRRALSVI